MSGGSMEGSRGVPEVGGGTEIGGVPEDGIGEEGSRGCGGSGGHDGVELGREPGKGKETDVCRGSG